MKEISQETHVRVATDKKLVISRFNNHKIVCNRSAMEQLHKIEHSLIIINCMVYIGESIIMSSIIKKLSE